MYGQLEEEGLGICAFCCMLNLIWCMWYSMDLWSIGGGTSVLSICAFCYMWNIFGVVVFHRFMVNWRGYMCPRYMCILLYVKLMWCSGIPWIYGQLEGSTSAISICAFCYMFNLFSVVVFCLGRCTFWYMWNWCGVVLFHRSMVNWRRAGGEHLCGVVVFHRCMINWRRGQLVWGYSSSENMTMSRWPYIVLLLATRCLYVKLIQCSGIPEIYGQLEENGLGIYTFLVYVKLIWCSGIP